MWCDCPTLLRNLLWPRRPLRAPRPRILAYICLASWPPASPWGPSRARPGGIVDDRQRTAAASLRGEP
eukprot:11202057-Lingulodinium_polyedra.AAC.1